MIKEKSIAFTSFLRRFPKGRKIKSPMVFNFERILKRDQLKIFISFVFLKKKKKKKSVKGRKIKSPMGFGFLKRFPKRKKKKKKKKIPLGTLVNLELLREVTQMSPYSDSNLGPHT